MDLRSHIYSLIKERRSAKGWSRNKLAEKAGVSVRTVERLEIEQDYSLGLKALERIASALELHPLEIIPTHNASTNIPAIRKKLRELEKLLGI